MDTRAKRCAMSASALLALVAHAPARAMPTAIPTAPALQTLENARAALASHRARDKVALIPEEDQGGVPSRRVYVVPTAARSEHTLKLVGTPQCGVFAERLDHVNQLSAALSDLSLESLQQALVIGQRWREYDDFLDAHRDALEAAREGNASRIEHQIALDALTEARRNATDPAVIAQLDARISAAQAARDAVETTPRFVEGWALKVQADAILAAIVQDSDAWSKASRRRFDDALAAVNMAKVAFNDLAALEVAVGDAQLPVWDDDVIDLFVRRPSSTVDFVPARLDDLAWDLREGVVDVIPPVTFAIFRRVGSVLVPVRSFPIPGDAPPAGSTVFQVLRSDEVTPAETPLGATTDAREIVRRTLMLKVRAPHVRLRLGMGAYCGSVREDAPSSSAETSQGSSGLVGRVDTRRYTFVPQADRTRITRIALGRSETPVLGPSLKTTCLLDSDRYVDAVRRGDGDLWFWTDASKLDAAVARRIEASGMQCDFAQVPTWADEGLRAAARGVTELAVAELGAYFSEFALGAPPLTSPAPPDAVARWKRSHPESIFWPAKVMAICGGEPLCSVPPVPLSTFEPQCETGPDGTWCTTRGARVSYSFERWGTYFKPVGLTSTLDFRVP